VKPDRSAPSRNNPVLWAAASMALIASPALAEPACQPVLLDGARCLFIGHSFFVPVAAAFDQLADPTLFPDHAYDRYFASGAMGSPGQLWDDADGSRTEIEGKLATGQVELLGLTMYGGLGSQLQDYRNWMDLALAYNPDTRFLIGIPWVAAGPSMTAEDFAALNDTWGDDTIQIVTELRAIYPKTRIDLINYGVVASELKVEAVEVHDLVPRRDEVVHELPLRVVAGVDLARARSWELEPKTRSTGSRSTGLAGLAVVALVDARGRPPGPLPLGAHVEQVDEEVVGERSGRSVKTPCSSPRWWRRARAGRRRARSSRGR
jgi:hypothetical protein